MRVVDELIVAASAKWACTSPLEVVATRRVAAVGVPVEAGARGRQQHGVARRRQASRGGDRGLPSTRPRRTGHHAGERGGMIGAASPRATTAFTRSCSVARLARSRPLLRPPASSTMRSKPRIAVIAACGVVAFESLYQRTPSSSPTGSMRCGGCSNVASASATAAGVGQPGLDARAPRRPARW